MTRQCELCDLNGCCGRITAVRRLRPVEGDVSDQHLLVVPGRLADLGAQVGPRRDRGEQVQRVLLAQVDVVADAVEHQLVDQGGADLAGALVAGSVLQVFTFRR